MLVKTVMTSSIEPLDINNTTRQAEAFVYDLDVFHVPITNQGKFIGILGFDLLTEDEVHDDIALGRFIDRLEHVSIFENAYVFDVLRVFVAGGYTALAVIDEEDNLLGLLRATDVIAYLSKTLSIQNPGAFITLELGQHDYNLQEISRIVESNNARILSLHFEPIQEADVLLCTIKINQLDLSHILATFDRFKYTCVAHSSISEHDDGMQDRYNLLMKFLNI